VSVSAGADEANDSGRGMCRWTVCESSMPGCQHRLLGRYLRGGMTVGMSVHHSVGW